MLKPTSQKGFDDDYLKEFRQKIATQRQEELEERRKDMHQTRNGFIGTVAGIVLAGVIGWVLLMPHFSNRQAADIPVIRRPLTPVKVQPNEPGGMEILNQDKSIYDLVEKKEIEPAKVESLLPQPETPKMPEIVPEPEVKEDPTPAETTVADLSNNASSASKTDLSPEQAMDELIDEVRSNATDQVVIPSKIKDIAVEVKTVGKEAPAAANQQPKTPVTETAKVAASSQTGDWQIQLFASANKASLEKTWENLKKQYAVLAPLPHEIESPTTDSLYRLKAGVFPDRQSAEQACSQIKQAGGACLVKHK